MWPQCACFARVEWSARVGRSARAFVGHSMAFYGGDVLIGGEFEDMMQTGELEDMMQAVSNGDLDMEILSCFPDALGDSSTREKAHRLRSSKIDYWESPWGLQMLHADVCDPTTREGKLFRSRFRVPFPFFALFLLPAVVAAGIWKDTTRTRVPAAFKLLAVLRGLGRALIMDVQQFPQPDGGLLLRRGRQALLAPAGSWTTAHTIL